MPTELPTRSTPLDEALARLGAGRNRDPFAVLGPHVEASGRIVIRALQPSARSVELRLPDGDLRAMTRRGDVFEIALDGTEFPDYRLRVTYPGGHVVEIDDPYRYGR